MTFYTTAQLSQQLFPKKIGFLWRCGILALWLGWLACSVSTGALSLPLALSMSLVWHMTYLLTLGQLYVNPSPPLVSTGTPPCHLENVPIHGRTFGSQTFYFLTPPYPSSTCFHSMFTSETNMQSHDPRMHLFIWALPIQIHTEGLVIKQNLFPRASLS